MNLKFINYAIFTDYKYGNMHKMHLLTGNISQEFDNGVNLLIGDIDSGWTAMVYSITPKAKTRLSYSAEIELDDENKSINDIKKKSAYLGKPIKSIFSCEKLLKKACQKRNADYKKFFSEIDFPEYLLVRKVSQLGKFTPVFLSIYYYLLGRKIFVMPWCSKNSMEKEILKSIVDFFKEKDCILLVPISSDYNTEELYGAQFH